MSRVILIVAVLLQVLAGLAAPASAPAPKAVDTSPLLPWLAFGDHAATARLSLLALQSADDSAGQRLALRDLDYAALEARLEACMRLDPRSDTPMQLAALVYARVNDPARSRRMLAFIARHYGDAPVRYRPWMDAAIVTARHHLDDPALAARLEAKLNQVQ